MPWVDLKWHNTNPLFCVALQLFTVTSLAVFVLPRPPGLINYCLLKFMYVIQKETEAKIPVFK